MDLNYLIGKQIGNFIIKKKIGEGSFATVFLVEEETNENNTKQYFACKVVPIKQKNDKRISLKLENEIKIHQLMHHPNVVQLIDIQKDSNFYYIFEEFVDKGELLNKMLFEGDLSESEVAFYFKQILIGLQYIHSLNVSHRDLKPDNILIDQYGTIKIADFGLSKIFKDDKNYFTKTPCGTLYYASPEVLSGNSYDSCKSDIWSCGVILYSLASGFLPWTHSSQTLLFKQIKNGEYKIPFYLSDCCADLINRLLTVDCDKRITIKEALDHPFLRKIDLSDPNFMAFISLKKTDHNERIDKIFDNCSKIEKGFINYRKKINLTDLDMITRNQKYEKKKRVNSNSFLEKQNILQF